MIFIDRFDNETVTGRIPSIYILPNIRIPSALTEYVTMWLLSAFSCTTSYALGTFITYHEFITSENILDIIKDYDFILDGTDNFPAKFLINEKCVMVCLFKGSRRVSCLTIFRRIASISLFSTPITPTTNIL
jgi:hypothetical protein